MPISEDAVEVDFEDGTATLNVSHQHVRDFGNIPNALKNGSSAAATVSYAIRWHGVKQRRRVNNSTLHVSGLFLDTGATIRWTGHNNATGFTFTSEDEGQKVVAAQLGHERNGVFFH